MKIGILIPQARVEKYSNWSQVSKDWQIDYLDRPYSDQDVLEKFSDADILFVDAVNPVSAQIIENMPKLKLIQSEGVAYNSFDVEAATKAGVYVCNNASANDGAVAEQAILLMLALLRRLPEGQQMVLAGRQIEAKSSFILDGIQELSSCHIGLIGFGAIGKATAKRLRAFECKISYYTPKQKDDNIEQEYGVSYMPLKQIAAQCDIVSLHLPVLPDTINMIDADFLRQMKKTAFLINTSRGEIVDHQALATAISQGWIAGAGIDTLFPEPATLANPLLSLAEEFRTKMIFSPHIAGTTNNVFYKMYKNSWQNIGLVAQGKKPNNIVNSI
jgi:lactate dehydrogenase-like 2-hydroxyacid dehydrogenase